MKNAKLNGSFSETQAAEFVEQWSVAAYQANTDSGFSATLFENVDGSYVYAIRGTEQPIADLLVTDGMDIVVDGLAINQIVDMYNDWKKITSNKDGTYQAAKLVAVGSLTLMNGRQVIEYDDGSIYFLENLGSNVVIDMPLGIAYTIEFEDRTDGLGIGPGQVTVVGHSMGGHLAMAFARLFPGQCADAFCINGAGFMTGILPGVGQFADLNIPNLFSMLGGAASFPAGKILNLYGDKWLEMTAMDQEWGLQQPGGYQGIYIESARGNTLGHGKEQMTDSLAVYSLFTRLDPSLQTQSFQEVFGRLTPIFETAEKVYKANEVLERIVNMFGNLLAPGFKSITKWDDRDSLYQAIAAIQKETKDKQYSITSLIGMSDSQLYSIAQGNNADGLALRYALTCLNLFMVTGDAGLYDRFNQNGELDLYDPDTGKGLTEQYLHDRAMFLTQIISPSGAGIYFRDQALNIQAGAQGSEISATTPYYLFGGQGSDTLVGGDGNDHLYGAGGKDTLFGGKGDDYLEGGEGKDTYYFYQGDGHDTIVDDGDNIIVYQSQVVAGQFKQEGGSDTYRSILNPDITLTFGGNGAVLSFGGAGNDILDGGEGHDALYGGDGDDWLYGGAGNDLIDGHDGDDYMEGGEGDDVLLGAWGNDILIGGLRKTGGKEIRKLTTRLLVCGLALFCQASWCQAVDYDDNIGFMKNPPQEWKEKYPSCDVFLDMKWEKSKPDHLAAYPRKGNGISDGRHYWFSDGMNWIGTTLVDMFEGDLKRRYGLISALLVKEGVSSGKIRIYQSTYIVSVENYNMFDLNRESTILVQAKDDDMIGPWHHYLGMVSTQRSKLEPKKISIRNIIMNKLERFQTMSRNTKNICLASPDGEAAWMLEASTHASPFASDADMSPDLKARRQVLFSLYQQDCPAMRDAFLERTGPCGGEVCPKCYETEALSAAIREYGWQGDFDGDGRPDFIFRCGSLAFVYFLYDENPFIMLFPKCPSPPEWASNGMRVIPDKNAIISAQQCVADAKKQYMINHSNK